jgi:hypothetical protein
VKGISECFACHGPFDLKAPGGRRYEQAKTYCFDFEKGDRVKFIDGSPLGLFEERQIDCVSHSLIAGVVRMKVVI